MVSLLCTAGSVSGRHATFVVAEFHSIITRSVERYYTEDERSSNDAKAPADIRQISFV